MLSLSPTTIMVCFMLGAMDKPVCGICHASSAPCDPVVMIIPAHRKLSDPPAVGTVPPWFLYVLASNGWLRGIIHWLLPPLINLRYEHKRFPSPAGGSWMDFWFLGDENLHQTGRRRPLNGWRNSQLKPADAISFVETCWKSTERPRLVQLVHLCRTSSGWMAVVAHPVRPQIQTEQPLWTAEDVEALAEPSTKWLWIVKGFDCWKISVKWLPG